jgi:D-glycero-D-manno-heptose 1,7-bisphosphate phosphatase
MNKNRALLLDRDGVINVDAGYVATVDRFTFIPGLFPFLRDVRDRGYRLAILTNQSGVGRGLFSEQAYENLTTHILDNLKGEGIDIDLVLACFMHPESKLPAYAYDSFWRKPNPGMVLEAIRRLDLDPSRSVFIGDSERDMQAAQAAGIGRCLWLTQDKPDKNENATIVRDFAQALDAIAKRSV